MKTFFQLIITLLFLSSCSKDLDHTLLSTARETATDQNTANKSKAGQNVYDAAESNATGNMSISIATTAKTTVNVTIAKVNITYLSEDTFTVVTNPGSLSQQTFSATQATITEPDTKLKVTKNPGVNQIIYTDKSICVVTASSTNQLTINIQPGNITTNAVSIVGDENEGI